MPIELGLGLPGCELRHRTPRRRAAKNHGSTLSQPCILSVGFCGACAEQSSADITTVASSVLRAPNSGVGRASFTKDTRRPATAGMRQGSECGCVCQEAQVARGLAGAVHHLKRTMTQRTRTVFLFLPPAQRENRSKLTHKEVSRRECTDGRWMRARW